MENKYTLPKEFGQKWLEALRSGKYKQTQDKLTDFEGGYCCLGVACVTVGIPILIMAEHNKGVIDDTWAYNYGIPESIESMHKELTDMNDLENKTFPEIADWIELNCEFV